MAGKTRIPIIISDFNNYINTTDDYQLAIDPVTTTANYVRLGLTLANSNAWTAARNTWATTLYPAYTNANTRTKTVNQQVKDFMAAFRTAASPLLAIMAASPAATAEDEAVFGFKIKRKKPTHRTEPIAEQCFATISMRGGSDLRITFRTSHDTKRASLAQYADSVQVAIRTGATAPVTPEDGTVKEIVTKASMNLHLGAAAIGNRFYIFCRWYNTRHPELAGPWSEMQTSRIA